MEPIERLHHEFPNIEIKDLGYGANLYTRIGVITIYWGKKKKYCINGKWESYSDFERVLFDIAASIHIPKKVAPIEPQVFSDEELTDIVKGINRMHHEKAKDELDEYCKHKSQQGIQNCINHISRKRDFIIANQPDNKLATFCLTLISELQQYL